MSLRVDAQQDDLGKDRRAAGSNSNGNGSARIIEKNNSDTFKQKIDNLSKEMDN